MTEKNLEQRAEENRTPRLYTGNNYHVTEEDREAVSLLDEAQVDFVILGPVVDTITPCLKYGIWRFFGVKEIKEFIELYKANKLPRYE
ncbi:MAG: hypothetical protein AABX71_00015 [Nanoarchaeota archaeon]